ncbi:hypothetical protein RJ639_017760 [Escallonia herrerae]|uniref:Isopenicillin N synthase-like Fe(2+) 2OG dioxygenase domain-containing protein n=1 Tax=Escallonia herrerae TaxID=1293975 RepID=A0AA89AJA0_9ASTE|nr:hypothetical protein RJ639_017760 [Escallonia herrerae]
MPPAAGTATHSDRIPVGAMMVPAGAVQPAAPVVISEGFAKDAIIAWFRGEFAAANAIIDALCSHLTQLEGGAGAAEYEAAFAAIHRRRLNWIPILQMQKYYSIADVALELRRVAAKKVKEEARNPEKTEGTNVSSPEKEEKSREASEGESAESNESGGGEVVDDDSAREDSPESEITDSAVRFFLANIMAASLLAPVGGAVDKFRPRVPNPEAAWGYSPGFPGGRLVCDPRRGRVWTSGKGSQEVHPSLENILICSNHEDCQARCDQIKMTKGFVAKEPVKGHMASSFFQSFKSILCIEGYEMQSIDVHIVNVVRGLKLYEDIFTDIELSKLTDFVNDLRSAGQNGELPGETFIMYNQQLNKRELIQLGAPIFGQIKDDAGSKCQKSYIEPIPATLQGVIDHLVQWHLISEYKKPNSCVINFFDEGEYSQPFQKPPHLEQPILTLLLSDSTMAFGRALVSDNDGNYKGSLMLSLKEGSLLVMRGSSADMARHVMCPSPIKRISITFFRVHADTGENNSSAVPPLTRAMTLWQPGSPNSCAVPNGTLNGAMDVIPKWGVLRSPMGQMELISSCTSQLGNWHGLCSTGTSFRQDPDVVTENRQLRRP